MASRDFEILRALSLHIIINNALIKTEASFKFPFSQWTRQNSLEQNYNKNKTAGVQYLT